MSRLTNRSIEIFTIILCYTANKAVNVKVIEACHKMEYVLSQITCINTYIKDITKIHIRK